MRATLINVLLLSAFVFSTAFATGQIAVKDINTLPSSTTAPVNCTDQPVKLTPPAWEFNCDAGSGNCTDNSADVCAYTPPTLVSHTGNGCGTTPDLQAREFDVSWPGDVNGGSIFHANLTTSDTRSNYAFSWGGWFCYTDMSQIWRVELDLNQIMSTDTVLILAAQCDMSTGHWQFQNGWGLGDSNIKCPTVAAGNWPVNTWVHIVVSATRCNPYVEGHACAVTYNSVYFYPPIAGNTALETCNGSACDSSDGRDQLNNWKPLGGLIENVQLDMNPTSPSSMTAYGDLMTTNSPQNTQVATPQASIAGHYVTLNTTTSLATICYATDGTTPTANGGGTCTHGITYTGPFQISGTTTVAMMGSKDGIDFDSPATFETLTP
jgi:Chitobiase/beta-hexosaminidase C-terminal domain